MITLSPFFHNLLLLTYSAPFQKQFIVNCFLSTFIVLGIYNVSAQTSQAQTATTRINIVLADVLSIDPGSAANGGTVDFQYETVADYNSDKTTTVPNSLIITFTKAFDLQVKANGANFENGTNLIPVDVLTIKRNENSNISGTSSPIVLSTQDQVLVSGVGHGSRLTLDLDYFIPKARSSSTDILGKIGGTYTQEIVYTVSAL